MLGPCHEHIVHVADGQGQGHLGHQALALQRGRQRWEQQGVPSVAALEQGVPHGTRLEEVIYEVLDQRYLEEEAYDRIGEVMDTVFGLKVDRGEMTANFTGKVRAAFAEAEGISFPTVARGYMLLRLAKVHPEKKSSDTGGSQAGRDVAAALQTTYPEGLSGGTCRGVREVEAEPAPMEDR